MKNDLDALMGARNLDAMMVTGKVLGNPPLVYMLNGARVTQGVIFKKRGEAPIFVCSPIEREEAVHAGYEIVLSSRFEFRKLLKEYEGDQLAASAAYYKCMFEEFGIKGRLGCYGYQDQGYAYALLSAVDKATPDVELVGEIGTDILITARATKDPAEIERIREIGQRTLKVVDATIAFLQAHDVNAAEQLITADGNPLTVGEVHEHITSLIAANGMEDPEGFIFATGRDAGVPHSRGNLNAVMRLGETIVFDIFPRGSGGGYFHDMTRTFCLGYAPETAQKLYDDVKACFEKVSAALKAGEITSSYQRMTCEIFEAQGHPTIMSTPATLDGYVHSLGHGVGLDIHESPGFYESPSNKVVLTPGHVITIEPGLYYPDRGLGVRLEDTVWLDENGEFHTMAPYPFELVVPMNGGK